MPIPSLKQAIALLLAAAAAGRLCAATLYVAPSGSDSGDGSRAQPVRTLGRIQEIVRNLHPLREAITVEIADGVYRLTEPLVFGPADSGTQEFPILYRAASGAHPRFTSEKMLEPWVVRPDGLWSARLPPAGKFGPPGEQLRVNGRFAPLARVPSAGLSVMRAVTETALNGEKPVVTSEGKRTSLHHARLDIDSVQPELLGPLASLPPEQINRVRIVAYQAWDVTIRFVAGISLRHPNITLLGTGLKYVNPLQAGTWFHLENVPAGLDVPGCCCMTAAGTVLYRPLPSEKDPHQSPACVPLLPQLLLLQGQPGGRGDVSHLAFEGLSFTGSAWSLPAAGLDPTQSSCQLEGAIQADFTRQVTFRRCNFERLSTYAIWFRRGCRDLTVQQCYFADLGGGAIRVGETPLPQNLPSPSGPDRTGWITLDNNIIRDCGRLFAGTTGIFIGRSSHNRVTHNDLSRLPYMGISLGWSWGYVPDDAEQNDLSYNRICHLGGTGMSDLGGIYTLGPASGTTINHNVIFDAKCSVYGGWGLYNDEGSTGIAMRDNLVYDCESGGYHLHFGADNRVENNIFAYGSAAQIVLSKADGRSGLTFAHNVVIWRNGPLFGTRWAEGQMTRQANLYCNLSGTPVRFGSQTLAQWEAAGGESQSMVADPGFVDPDHGDFRFRPDTPVRQIGFEPFNPNEAGVYGPAEWRRQAGMTN